MWTGSENFPVTLMLFYRRCEFQQLVSNVFLNVLVYLWHSRGFIDPLLNLAFRDIIHFKLGSLKDQYFEDKLWMSCFLWFMCAKVSFAQTCSDTNTLIHLCEHFFVYNPIKSVNLTWLLFCRKCEKNVWILTIGFKTSSLLNSRRQTVKSTYI